MYQCPECWIAYPKLISLSIHYRSIHKKTAKQLSIALNYDGVQPVCKCGCGSSTKFLSVDTGFREYVLGHAARVNNNWGHNAKASASSLETRRKMLGEGTWKPFMLTEIGEHWATGLTKETDSRIAKMSEAIRSNHIEVIARSKRMSENRKNGIIPTLCGPKHPQWKGGHSSLLSVCHGNKRLFQEWKYPKLVFSKFACEICGASRDKEPRPNLEVHHNKVKMATVVRLIAEGLGWSDYYGLAPDLDVETQKLKIAISEAVTDYHIQNNVSGIVLCEECHKKQHPKHNL